MTQDAAAVAEVEDVTVETPETETKETEENSSDVESDEGEVQEEPQETVEEKLERLQKETEGKQKAIDRKTAAYHALQKKYEEQRQERERLTQLIEQQQPSQEPVIDDFETHEDYVNALVEYRSKAAIQEQQQKLMAQQAQMEQERIMQERLSIRQEQEAEYMKENPMYKAAANEVDAYIKTLGDVSESTQMAVIDQLYRGNVAQVIDYFGSDNGANLDELGKISKLTPPEAAVEIYKIQQRLSSTPKKEKIKPESKPVKVDRGNTKTSKPLTKKSGKEVLDWVNS